MAYSISALFHDDFKEIFEKWGFLNEFSAEKLETDDHQNRRGNSDDKTGPYETGIASQTAWHL